MLKEELKKDSELQVCSSSWERNSTPFCFASVLFQPLTKDEDFERGAMREAESSLLVERDDGVGDDESDGLLGDGGDGVGDGVTVMGMTSFGSSSPTETSSQ